MTYDVVIVGKGALALFSSFKAHKKGLSSIRIGKGVPFERFLLLHENAVRVLERNYGTAFGHSLRGLKVLDRNLKMLREFDFQKYGIRLHSARYSHLYEFMKERAPGEEMEDWVEEILPDGVVKTKSGKEFRAGRFVINTAKGFTKPLLKFRHRKVFHMGFINMDFDRQWVYQINDRGTYVAVVPFEEDFAIVYSGDPTPAENLLGIDPKDMDFMKLELETYYSPFIKKGRVYHVGEAIRRVHPHTGQGLNRALDTIEAIFENKSLLKESTYDFFMWLGGVLLDLSWGSSPFLRDLSFRFLDSKPGARILSGTL